MKKIILAFDGDNYSNETFEFVRKLNELQPVLVSGVFLPELVYPGEYAFTGRGTLEMPVLIPFMEKYDKDKANKIISLFKRDCEKNHIEYRVHEWTEGFPLELLKKESLFADLLIISSRFFYDSLDNDNVSEYVRIVCHEAECPVIVVPDTFEFPENIVLAYNGSKSSIFAIKQFTYIFPELCNRNTLLVYANDDGPDSIPASDYLEEWAPRHFNNLTFLSLYADPKEEFGIWLKTYSKSILVAGAYDRSTFSELFKKSFVENIIKENQLPVFIAHK